MEEKNKSISEVQTDDKGENIKEKQEEKAVNSSPKKEKPDKLAALKAKREKAEAAVEKAAKKAKLIEGEIAAEEQRRRDRQIKQLDGICKNMKIDLGDIISLITIISEKNITILEAAEIIGVK